MAYATLAAMVARFGEDELIALTAPLDATAPDAAMAGQALADASAVIDGYLASRYALPLETVPALLEPLCCDIARYRLAAGGSVHLPTDIQRQRYDDALIWLAQVAAGKIGLGLDPGGNEPPVDGGATGASWASRRPRVFDAAELADYDYRGWGRAGRRP